MNDSKMDEEMIEAVTHLSENYVRAFSEILGTIQDSPYLSHGDYWIPNVMYGPHKGKMGKKGYTIIAICKSSHRTVEPNN